MNGQHAHNLAGMNCRFGRTADHVFFIALQLAVLAWFAWKLTARSARTAMILRVLVFAHAACAVLYHVSFSVLCWMPSAYARLADITYDLDTDSFLFRIRTVILFISSQIVFFAAAHFIDVRSHGGGRLAKLAVARTLALANACALHWFLQQDHSPVPQLRRTADAIRVLQLSSVVLTCTSLVFILSVTRSYVVGFHVFVASPIMLVGNGILSAALKDVHDVDARLVLHHILDFRTALITFGLSHAVLTSGASREKSRLTASRLITFARSEWFAVSALAVAAGLASRHWCTYSALRITEPFYGLAHAHPKLRRELLGMESEPGVDWETDRRLLYRYGGCILLLLVVMLPWESTKRRRVDRESLHMLPCVTTAPGSHRMGGGSGGYRQAASEAYEKELLRASIAAADGDAMLAASTAAEPAAKIPNRCVIMIEQSLMTNHLQPASPESESGQDAHAYASSGAAPWYQPAATTHAQAARSSSGGDGPSAPSGPLQLSRFSHFFADRPEDAPSARRGAAEASSFRSSWSSWWNQRGGILGGILDLESSWDDDGWAPQRAAAGSEASERPTQRKEALSAEAMPLLYRAPFVGKSGWTLKTDDFDSSAETLSLALSEPSACVSPVSPYDYDVSAPASTSPSSYAASPEWGWSRGGQPDQARSPSSEWGWNQVASPDQGCSWLDVGLHGEQKREHGAAGAFTEIAAEPSLPRDDCSVPAQTPASTSPSSRTASFDFIDLGECFQEDPDAVCRQAASQVSGGHHGACGCSGSEADCFELVVHPNFTRRCDNNCELCKRGMVLANNLPFIVEGRLKPDHDQLNDAVMIKVEVMYVAVHHPEVDSNRDDADEAKSVPQSWVLKRLGVSTVDSAAPTLKVVVPPKTLMSTWNGIASTKRAIANAPSAASRVRTPVPGSFRTYIRAEVTCIGSERVRSFRVQSPEVYVCSDRNLRKMCNLRRSTAASEDAI